MGEQRSCDAWADLMRQARALPDDKVSEQANVSTRNGHRCVECFTCACATVREERQRGTAPHCFACSRMDVSEVAMTIPIPAWSRNPDAPRETIGRAFCCPEHLQEVSA